MYKYEVKAICKFEKNNMTSEFNKEDFEYRLNSDLLQEAFYYGISNNDEFIATYESDIKFDFVNYQYTITYIAISKNKDLIDDFINMYSKEDFDLNEIFCRDGNSGDEWYSDFHIDKFKITNIDLFFSFFVMSEEDLSKYQEYLEE
jgi:hypothetical protein